MLALQAVVMLGTALIGFGGLDDPARAVGDPLKIKIPLSDQGEISVNALVKSLSGATGLPVNTPDASLDLPVRGLSAGLIMGALEEALGPGVDLTAEGNTIIVSIDPSLLTPAAAPAWQRRVQTLANRVQEEAARDKERYGMRPLRSYRPNDPSRPTVVLVHGMNSSSGCFQHMAPQLEKAGYGVIVYDFPDNLDLDRCAPTFARDWKSFRKKSGEKLPWAVVCHSMGSLIARWYVEGDSFSEDVTDLILIGPPNQGAALARAQTLLQFIRGLDLMGEKETGSMSTLGEGVGEAAEDILPGSAFLRRLNAKPRRAGVNYRILAGNRGFITEEMRKEIETQIESAVKAAGLFGRLLRLANPELDAQLASLSDGTGDGVVDLKATRLAGVDPPVVIPANHVELIRGPSLYPFPGPIVSMPKVLEWLPKPALASP